MSQSAVGGVYNKIVDAVCEQSQVDFEEGGIDQGTLELLKSGWKNKLTDLHVGHMPWEPAPAPVAPQHTVPSNPPAVKHQPSSLPSNGVSTPTPPLTAMKRPPSTDIEQPNAGPRIKTEPGLYSQLPPQQNGYQMPQVPSMAPYPPNVTHMSANQRAAMELQSKYGAQAANQINQLRQQGPRPMQAPANGPYIKQDPDRKPTPQSLQYPPNMQQPPQHQVHPSQIDGATDSLAGWKAEIAHRRELAAQNPDQKASNDRLLHEHFQELQQRMEGGGLMLPLDEHQRSRKRRNPVADIASVPSLSTSTAVTSTLPSAQGDAPADDADEEEEEEKDEDAINSDLDDPPDPADDENNEENVTQIMLCTYDKVQRVKNKWKCTLKDGIVRVGGTDYVFHKGQGEFEW